MKWFRHAFAVDSEGLAEPTADQQFAVDWACIQIARRRLTTPGLIFLEMSRPLNWIGAQSMHFMQPGAWALLSDKGYEGYRHFSEFLEHRGSMEYFCRRIEHFEDQFERIEREGGDIKEFISRHMDSIRIGPDEAGRAVESQTHEDKVKNESD